jgi:hypothetical protein
VAEFNQNLNFGSGIQTKRKPFRGFFIQKEPFRTKKIIKILAQENDLVRLFGEMTNSPALSE